MLVVTDTVTVPWLVLGSFLIGAAFSFLGPARQGLMVELVGPTRRGNAIALSQVALNASRVLAPLLAAAFLAVDAIGAGGSYFAMMGLYLGAMYSTFLMPGTKAGDGPRRPVLGEIWTGLQYVARTPSIRTLVVSYVSIIAIGFAYTAVLPGLVKNEFGRPASDITILLLANAAGGLLASLLVASRADSSRAGLIYTGMCGLFAISLVATGLAPGYWAVAATMFFVGAGGGGFQTLNGALVSHLTDPAFFGRVISLTFLAFAVANVVSLPVGALADVIGERETILASGIVVTVIVILLALSGRATRPGAAEAVVELA
jgi:MFS family permease